MAALYSSMGGAWFSLVTNANDMLTITKKLEAGTEVYLKTQEYDNALIKLVPVGDGITLFTAWVKFKGKPEYQVETSTTLVMDAMMAEEEVTARDYANL